MVNKYRSLLYCVLMQLLILFTYSTVLVADVNESFFDEEAIRTALIDFTGNSDTDRRRALIVLVSAFNHENIKDVPLMPRVASY